MPTSNAAPKALVLHLFWAMAKLRDLCCISTFLLLLLSISACSVCAVLAFQNFRFSLFITLSLVLISFPDLVSFILGSVAVCVLAIARAGGTDSVSKVQLMSLTYHLWSIWKLLSRKISCVESDLSKVIAAVVNEEDWRATNERESTVNVESEKVIEEVSDHGKPSEFQATETHVDTPTEENPSELPYTTTQLKVALHCEGCKRKIVEALCRMEGVKKIDISMRKQRVVVSGHVDPMKVLKKLKKTGKNVEFWSEETCNEGKPESDDKPQQIPVPDEENSVQHLECPAVSSTSTCIDEPQYHITKEVHEETEVKAMEDCPVEPFAMDAEGQEVPVILGTINLKRYTFLDAEVDPSNPRYPSSVDRNVAREQLSRPAMAARTTSKEVRPLYSASDDAYHKTLHPAAYHRDSFDRQAGAGYGRLRKPAGSFASGHHYADENIAHRSAPPQPEKQDEDESVTEVSDTSDDEALQLYAVVRKKKGSMKFVPVESAASMAAIAGKLPPHYEQVERSKSSRVRAERAQDACFQPSNSKHYADRNYWPSNKPESQYARSSRHYPHTFKNDYRSRVAYRMHHHPPDYAHEKEDSELDEHMNTVCPCREDPMQHPCEHEQVQRRRAHPAGRMHMRHRYNASERDQ